MTYLTALKAFECESTWSIIYTHSCMYIAHAHIQKHIHMFAFTHRKQSSIYVDCYLHDNWAYFSDSLEYGVKWIFNLWDSFNSQIYFCLLFVSMYSCLRLLFHSASAVVLSFKTYMFHGTHVRFLFFKFFIQEGWTFDL